MIVLGGTGTVILYGYAGLYDNRAVVKAQGTTRVGYAGNAGAAVGGQVITGRSGAVGYRGNSAWRVATLETETPESRTVAVPAA
jgi:hypothetical protein